MDTGTGEAGDPAAGPTAGPPGGARTHPAVVPHTGTYRFPVAPEEVWTAIEDVRRFPRWWSWLRDFEADGHRLEPGLVMRARVVPPVPYAMRLTVEIDEVTPGRRVRARVAGDLTGPACLRLTRTDDGCELSVGWRVEMRRPAMRAAARLSRPVLIWGHDRLVENTVRRFRQRIDRDSPHQ